MSIRLLFFFLIGLGCNGRLQAQSALSLKQALDKARSNNPVLRVERFNEQIAQADVITARLRPNLTLNNQTLQLTDARYFAPGTGWYSGQNRQDWWQLTKVFQWPGQRKNRIDLALQNQRLEQANYNETLRHVLMETATAWLECRTALQQLELVIIAKTNIDSLVKTNQLRLKNQVITATDVLRTELLAEQYALQIRKAEQEIVSCRNRLALLLDVKPDNLQIDTSDNFADLLPWSATGVDSLVALAVERRADLQALRRLQEVAQSNLRLQKSLAAPQPELGIIFNPQNSINYFGIFATIDLPVFDRNQGEIRKAQVLQSQASEQLLAARLRLQSEIATAWSEYQTYQAAVARFESILQQSQTILDNVRYAYLRGGTSIVDFLEAQRSWLETRQLYYETLQSFHLRRLQLLHVTGTIAE